MRPDTTNTNGYGPTKKWAKEFFKLADKIEQLENKRRAWKDQTSNLAPGHYDGVTITEVKAMTIKSHKRRRHIRVRFVRPD